VPRTLSARPDVHILLHRCRNCGVEWSQLGNIRTGDCGECNPKNKKKPQPWCADNNGVEVYPVEPL